MSDSFDLPSEPFPVENSTFYHFWLMERAEIDKLKWLESERAGADIGLDRARWIWAMHGHRAKWLGEMRSATGLSPQF